jgi:hypothetical protein
MGGVWCTPGQTGKVSGRSAITRRACRTSSMKTCPSSGPRRSYQSAAASSSKLALGWNRALTGVNYLRPLRRRAEVRLSTTSASSVSTAPERTSCARRSSSWAHSASAPASASSPSKLTSSLCTRRARSSTGSRNASVRRSSALAIARTLAHGPCRLSWEVGQGGTDSAARPFRASSASNGTPRRRYIVLAPEIPVRISTPGPARERDTLKTTMTKLARVSLPGVH